MLAHKYLKQPWVRNSVTLQMRKLGFERDIGMCKGHIGCQGRHGLHLCPHGSQCTADSELTNHAF